MNFNIESIKRKMLVKYPFFGSIVANVNYKENNDVPTAGTDGQTIYYNKEFLQNLNQNEQTFLFAHEVCHIAFDHIKRSEGKNFEIWNTATDAVINQFLKKDGLKIIEGAIDIEEAINYDSEELYDKLLKDYKENENNEQNQNYSNKSPNENQSNKPDNQNERNASQETENEKSFSSNHNSSKKENDNLGHDTHSMWKDAINKQKEKISTGNENENNNQDLKEKKLQEEIEKISKMKEQDAFAKNLEEKKKELEELKESLCNETLSYGTTTNKDQRYINNIGTSKPIIDWRYILREAIQHDVDWSYQNAYIEDGVISANLEEQPMPETEIVLDTSGSINETLLKNFLRECKNILKYSKVKVGCFDTEFYGFHEIKTEEDIENMKFIGGGGTNFEVAIRAFTKRVENKIIFTDGQADIPNIPLDAIWIVFGNIQINPKGGKVIQITNEQLDKLYSFETTSYIRKRHR